MVKDLFIPVTIHICPTIRHEDGLAMSSRNRYLSEKERTNGLILFKALNAGLHVYETLKCAGKEPSRNEILQIAQNMIDECDGVELEYLSLVDPQNLNEYESKIDRAIFSGAIRVGKIRLIDNILLGMSVNDWSIQE